MKPLCRIWAAPILLLSLGVLQSYGQSDSTRQVIIVGDSNALMRIESEQPIDLLKVSSPLSPREAAKRSAVLPGLGQIYNGKYWKVPIVYAALGGIGYAVYWNNQQYLFFKNSFENAVLSGNTANIDRLRFLRNTYRREKEFYTIIAVLVYGLNVVDAIVDAHLSSFDLNEDLSFRWKPQWESIGFGQQLVGMGFSISF
jgi:hypothetical protein